VDVQHEPTWGLTAMRRSAILRATMTALLSAVLATASAVAASRSAMDRGADEVRADLGRKLNCTWKTDGPIGDCSTGLIRVTIEHTADDRVESAYMVAFVEATPPEPEAAKINREAAVTLIRYLLPNWKQGPAWLRRAIAHAGHVCVRHVTKLGPITVMVQSMSPIDRPENYAEVIVTRRASLDQWLCDMNCRSCAND